MYGAIYVSAGSASGRIPLLRPLPNPPPWIKHVLEDVWGHMRCGGGNRRSNSFTILGQFGSTSKWLVPSASRIPLPRPLPNPAPQTTHFWEDVRGHMRYLGVNDKPGPTLGTAKAGRSSGSDRPIDAKSPSHDVGPTLGTTKAGRPCGPERQGQPSVQRRPGAPAGQTGGANPRYNEGRKSRAGLRARLDSSQI